MKPTTESAAAAQGMVSGAQDVLQIVAMQAAGGRMAYECDSPQKARRLFEAARANVLSAQSKLRAAARHLAAARDSIPDSFSKGGAS